MVLIDGTATALGAYLDVAASAEVTRLETTFNTVVVGRPAKPGRLRRRPTRLIADRCCDSNLLRAHFARRGIEPIIQARTDHRQPTLQDDCTPLHYRRRWTWSARLPCQGIFGVWSCTMKAWLRPRAPVQ